MASSSKLATSGDTFREHGAVRSDGVTVVFRLVLLPRCDSTAAHSSALAWLELIAQRSSVLAILDAWPGS
jgi:hypothetical protein